MKIGYRAPAPESRSGVADYAVALRKALEQLGLSTVEHGAAIDLYHLGNNGLHASIYTEALRKPGVVVLHDAVLHHFLLGRLSRSAYVDEFVYNYGEWQRGLAEELWEERGGSAVDPRYFEYPLLKRVASSARAVVVHNPAAARAAEAHGARNVRIIPHLAFPIARPDAAAAAQFRERRRIPQTSTLFGIFGYLRETKRVMPAIQAFKRLHETRHDTAMLIAGDAVSKDLDRLLGHEPPHPAIFRTGFLEDGEFNSAAAAIDCCLNLRYPGAGETSGITIRMAAMGVPLILTDAPETGGFPAASCLRVRSGIAEAAELFDYMGLIAGFPQVAQAIGHAARRHLAERHSLDSVARQYRDLLCALAA